MENIDLKELSSSEIEDINGGYIEFVAFGLAVAGALYGAGYALGQAYYNYTHPKP